MGAFRYRIDIGDPQGQRYERVEALVDTGASYTTLPTSLLRRLGVEPGEEVELVMADGRRVIRSVGQTWLRIDGRRVVTIVVFGDENAMPLLGASSMEGLRLDVDPTNRRLVRAPGLSQPQPHYSKEEFARIGDEIYDCSVRPHVVEGDEGKFVAIDIETGAYEVDANELVASDRLLARNQEAQIWLTRVGSRCVRRFGLQHGLGTA